MKKLSLLETCLVFTCGATLTLCAEIMIGILYLAITEHVDMHYTEWQPKQMLCRTYQAGGYAPHEECMEIHLRPH